MAQSLTNTVAMSVVKRIFKYLPIASGSSQNAIKVVEKEDIVQLYERLYV